MTADLLEREVATYLDHLAVERGLAANTLGAYRRDLRRYVDFLHSRGVDDLARVREAEVTGFLAAIRTGEDGAAALSASSAARTVVAVRGLHRFLVLEGRAATDPAGQVQPPSTPKRLPKAIGLDAVERVLAAAGGGEAEAATGLRDRALLELLYGCGARISEAVGCAVDDLDTGEKAVLDLGATKHEHQPGQTFRVFLDPAGHPFCLCVS